MLSYNINLKWCITQCFHWKIVYLHKKSNWNQKRLLIVATVTARVNNNRWIRQLENSLYMLILVVDFHLRLWIAKFQTLIDIYIRSSLIFKWICTSVCPSGECLNSKFVLVFFGTFLSSVNKLIILYTKRNDWKKVNNFIYA